MIRLLLALARPLLWLLGAVGLYAKGRTDARRETALEAAERYAATRKSMDDADDQISDDPAVLRDYLRLRDPGLK